ncbi:MULTISPECIES: ribbon-helix-helix protein, CopG family [Brucella]|uniref:ribbon-helix-helix protein, CopG family n=1 Tax=Brucella TaxID=234 RepID=UPI00124DB79E|nr:MULTISPECIES: ribbon-helix-helix protein, CopG family [Brucella]KAB2752253.1 ribbon-helix-helix protein, CopG family [Brucella anthropi]QNQ63075.1 ribbon-helix-helix protein, CopG family [Brucella sp. 6810]
MQKSLPISFRLPAETKAALEKAAQDDMRSVSSLMEKLVTDWLREKGYLSDDK